ncbi:hypothetical protein CKO42_09005 [Lamprobacter modestohalophilus]|uniref:Uncharacterized protein n=2 Tax=Lamprobacter modestohalophilus TaxID=1064514 RepID=A0A9X0W958_9GAMM|nr:hypothetical protein [Lamprobacter modestohalophilus]
MILKMAEESSLSVVPQAVPMLNVINKNVSVADLDYHLIGEIYQNDLALFNQVKSKMIDTNA